VSYGNHGEENVAGSGSLKGSDGRVNERVDRRGGEDEAGGKKADNLVELASERRVVRLVCWHVRRHGRSAQHPRRL
jgi:hypothetical protein